VISVIIPVYNATKYLAETIQSVQAQTCDAWEIVIVDDGSTDDTLAMAEELQKQDARISVRSQRNAGVSAARNLGLAKSRPDYPYALFLDGDDLLTPAALQTLHTLLGSKPESPAACGFLQDINADGQPRVESSRLEALTDRRGVEGLRLVRRAPDAPLVFGDVCFHNHIITAGQVLIRKSALQIAGAFDLSFFYLADYDLWWRLIMRVGPIAVSPEVVLKYRHHDTSMSSKSRVARRRDPTDFRWRWMTHPDLSPEQRRVVPAGYFYHCAAGFGFGWHYLKRGEVKHGLKHAGLAVRNLLRCSGDLVRLRRYAALGRPATR